MDDIGAFVAVLVAVAQEGRWIETEAPVDAEQRAERLRAQIAAGDVLLVLEDDGRHVGNAALHRTHAAGVVSLGMAIVADARGRGGGRVLIEALIALRSCAPAGRARPACTSQQQHAALVADHGAATTTAAATGVQLLRP